MYAIIATFLVCLVYLQNIMEKNCFGRDLVNLPDVRKKRCLKKMYDNPNIQDEFGATPLMNAIADFDDNAVSSLLAHPLLHVNIQDIWGSTALHYAIDNENIEATKQLLKHSQIKNLYDNDGVDVLKLLRKNHRSVLFRDFVRDIYTETLLKFKEK